MRLPLAFACCAVLLACEPESGLVVRVIPAGLVVVQARVELFLDDSSLGAGTVPDEPKAFSEQGETLRLLVPPEAVGEEVRVVLTGLLGGAAVGTGEASVTVTRGSLTTVDVRLAAQQPSCGDGVIDDGEQCDDADKQDGDGCSSECAIETGYECNGSTSVCTPTCGNGSLQVGEECDDGGVDDGDGCSSGCAVESGFSCFQEPSSCAPTCGNLVLDAGEECDDGGITAGDGCSGGCRVEPGFSCNDELPSVCAPTCGNGILDGAEECDDTGIAGGDGCSASCVIEPGYACFETPSVCAETCGNGVLDLGEACDDAGIGANDGCSASCRVEPGYACLDTPSTCQLICSNGVLDDGEECDDLNVTPGDGCTERCIIETGFECFAEPLLCQLICSNGRFDPDEECDDGDGEDGDGCSAACTTEPGYVCVSEPSTCALTCGNSAFDVGEQCDDGNTQNGDGCTASCAVEPLYVCGEAGSACRFTCGDSILDLDTGEFCDDGNTSNDDGCSNACAVELGFRCSPACTPVCGDGLIRGGEECDDAARAANDGCSPDCTLDVGASCTSEPSVCTRGCLIDDGVNAVIVPIGTIELGNACFRCDPDVDPLRFSPLLPLAACGTNPDFCDGDDVCQTDSNGVFRCLATLQNPCSGTTPSCFEPLDECRCDLGSCDDGVACNGAEACGADGQCQLGSPPCNGGTPVCVEKGGGAVDCFQCVTASDCSGNAGGPCCLDNVCTAQDGACPCGEHNGGDGVCVPDGECSSVQLCDSNGLNCVPQFLRPFVDNDLDGVGVGTALPTCVDRTQIAAGFAAVDGDCNDADSSVDHLAAVAPDADGDGFTGVAEVRCVGNVLPPGFAAVAAPPPVPGLQPRTISGGGSGIGNGIWTTPENAFAVDGAPAANSFRFNTTISPLVLTGFDLAVPPTAQIRGIVVQLVRRRSNPTQIDTLGVTDATVRLVVNGATAGTNHASATSWTTTLDTVSYGSPTDTWGLALSPAQVNAANFGVTISVNDDGTGKGLAVAEIDGLRLDVFISEGTDCNDSDPQRFSTWFAADDGDEDRYGVGGSLRCISGQPTQRQLIGVSLGNDCLDSDARSFPGQSLFFTTPRGDGGFDYDCSNDIEKQSVTDTVNCTISSDAQGQCVGCNPIPSAVTPAEDCGQVHDQGTCGLCPTCLVETLNVQVACH